MMSTNEDYTQQLTNSLANEEHVPGDASLHSPADGQPGQASTQLSSHFDNTETQSLMNWENIRQREPPTDNWRRNGLRKFG